MASDKLESGLTIKSKTQTVTTSSTGDFHITSVFGIAVSKYIAAVPNGNNNYTLLFSGNGWLSFRDKNTLAQAGETTISVTVYYRE